MYLGTSSSVFYGGLIFASNKILYSTCYAMPSYGSPSYDLANLTSFLVVVTPSSTGDKWQKIDDL
jgi:hypothetical protein